MRLFKKIKRRNLTYILSELALLFIGINLAIWFNDWNTSKKIDEAKAIAVEKIIDEIESNQLEVKTVMENNNAVLNAYKEFKNLYSGNTSVVKADPLEMQRLIKKYPGYFTILDSTMIDEGSYLYEGRSRINLEVPTLKKIAWETTIAKNISAEFSYGCLYELESVYNLQQRVQIEIDKSADALQKGDIESLMVILDFLNQLGNDLEQDYEALKGNIINCS